MMKLKLLRKNKNAETSVFLFSQVLAFVIAPVFASIFDPCDTPLHLAIKL